MIASNVMTVNVITVSPDHGVRHAAKMMLDHHVSGLPVVQDDGRLVGIVTEGDFLRRTEFGLRALTAVDQKRGEIEGDARAYVKSHSWKVADVMTLDPITVGIGTSLDQIAALMMEHGIKRLPVITDKRLVGIVSRADLLQTLIAAKFDNTPSDDEALRRSIRTRLHEDAGLKNANITLTVEDGVVHFWGTVDSRDERDAARVVAESLSGVRGVIDHLVQRLDSSVS